MKKVTIKGESGPHNALDVNILDGLSADCGENEFVQYFDDSPFYEKLGEGYMSFVVENGKLYTLTEYSVKETLTEEELQELANYTQGHWSDGIGEGFEQFSCMKENGEEIYVSPWCRGQKLEIIVK